VKYTSNLSLDWKSIRHSLQNHQVALEFISIDGSVLPNNVVSESYGAVLLKKDWENPKFVVLSDKVDVDKLSNRIVEAFNNGNGLKGAQWNYVGKQLFKRIWEPLTAYMEPGDTIYFSPIGLLSLVPLEALPNSEGIAIDDIFVIHRVSSTRDLCKPERPKNINNVVLFGGLTYTAIQDTATINNFGKSRKGWQELPATADEVENITYKLKEYGIKTETFENAKGTEVAFRGLTGSHVDIIHIATHGFYFNDKESNMLQFLRSIDIKPRQDNHVSPLQRTGLMLSGGQAAWLGLRKQKRDADGILLSSEIASLDLHNVGLVVLSACQTGLGDISEDGVVGLQRAFKMAGVETLIMTLWKVDDKATSYMMVNFYNQLLSGKDKHDAFRIAKKMVKDKFKDPFYWAPFIMLD
jgi:CHAT domain-containing protein